MATWEAETCRLYTMCVIYCHTCLCICWLWFLVCWWLNTKRLPSNWLAEMTTATGTLKQEIFVCASINFFLLEALEIFTVLWNIQRNSDTALRRLVRGYMTKPFESSVTIYKQSQCRNVQKLSTWPAFGFTIPSKVFTCLGSSCFGLKKCTFLLQKIMFFYIIIIIIIT
jgi:hypothetical protein